MKRAGVRLSSLARAGCAALLLSTGACNNDGLVSVPVDLAVAAADFADLCGPNLLDCDGRCVDWRSDTNNCGACGRACGDAPCEKGACKVGTPMLHTRYAPTTYPAGGLHPVELAIGDLDGDGRLDVVTANGGSGDVSLLRNLGGGKLGPASISLGVPRPRALVLADFDAAAPTPDVAVLGGDGVMLVQVSRNGSLAFASRTFSGPQAEGLAGADFNGDHLPDVAVASAGTSSVWVHYGDGHGAFDPVPVNLQLPAAPGAVATADFERDGTPDIVASAGAGKLLYLVLGRGGRIFTAPRALSAVADPLHGGLVATDLNEDNAPDMVSGGTSRLAYVYGKGIDMNQIVGFGATVEQVPPGPPFKLDGLAIGWLRDDRLFDLVTVSEQERAVRVFLGFSLVASPVFAQPDVYAAPGPRAVALGDLNGDGRLDIVTANPSDNSVTVLLDTL